MADITNLSQFLTDIANAIRTKKKTAAEISAADFDKEILTLETGVIDETEYNECNQLVDELLGYDTGYEKLHHIVWNDTQLGLDTSHVDTNCALLENVNWKMTLDISLNQLMNYQHLLFLSSENVESDEVYIDSTGALIAKFGGKTCQYSELFTTNARRTITMEYSKTTSVLTVGLDGVTEVFSGVTPTQVKNTIKIGGINIEDDYSRKLDMNIYGIKFYADNRLLVNLTPAKKISTEVNYLYDTINGVYLKPDNITLGGVSE